MNSPCAKITVFAAVAFVTSSCSDNINFAENSFIGKVRGTSVDSGDTRRKATSDSSTETKKTNAMGENVGSAAGGDSNSISGSSPITSSGSDNGSGSGPGIASGSGSVGGSLQSGSNSSSTNDRVETVAGVHSDSDETKHQGLISTSTDYKQTSSGEQEFLVTEGDIMRVDLSKQAISGFEYLDMSYSGSASDAVPASTPVLFGKAQNIDAMHLLADGKLVFSLPNRELDASTYKVPLGDNNLDLWVYDPNASGNKISVYGQFNAPNADSFKTSNVDALQILDSGVLLSFSERGSIQNTSGATTSYRENDLVYWNGSSASVVMNGSIFFQTDQNETANNKGNIDALHVREFDAKGGLKIVDGLHIRVMIISTSDPFVVKLSSGWSSKFSFGDLVKIVFNNDGSIQSATSIYLEDPQGLNTGNEKNIDAYTEKH